MAKDLVVHAPIEIPFRKKGKLKHIYGVNVRAFWKQRPAKAIAAKKGCYIFALRAAKG